MDHLLCKPICQTTLEFEEKFSGSGSSGASLASEADETGIGEKPPLKELTFHSEFLVPRFKRFAALSTSQATAQILQSLFGKFDIASYESSVSSCPRSWVLTFSFSRLRGRYCQVSQTEKESPVWDTSDGRFEEVPQLYACLQFDGDVVVECSRFASCLDPEGLRSTVKIEGELLRDGFGSETVAKLGGLKPLLQFLGVLCVDMRALDCISLLPFELTSRHVLSVFRNADLDAIPNSLAQDAKKGIQPLLPSPLPPSSRPAATRPVGAWKRTSGTSILKGSNLPRRKATERGVSPSSRK